MWETIYYITVIFFKAKKLLNSNLWVKYECMDKLQHIKYG